MGDDYYWKLKVQAGRKYDPGQPRVPSGDPRGGQWTSSGGGSSDWNGDPDDLDWSDRERWDQREQAIQNMAKAGSVLVRQMETWGSIVPRERYAGVENHLRMIENLIGDPLISWEHVADLDQFIISPKVQSWTKPEQWKDAIRAKMPKFEPRYPTKSEVARRRQADWESGADIAHFPDDLREELMAQRRRTKKP